MIEQWSASVNTNRGMVHFRLDLLDSNGLETVTVYESVNLYDLFSLETWVDTIYDMRMHMASKTYERINSITNENLVAKEEIKRKEDLKLSLQFHINNHQNSIKE